VLRVWVDVRLVVENWQRMLHGVGCALQLTRPNTRDQMYSEVAQVLKPRLLHHAADRSADSRDLGLIASLECCAMTRTRGDEPTGAETNFRILQCPMSDVDAVAAINRAVAEIDMPSSIHGNFAGTAATFQVSLASEP
jgi:hypothetical protein